MYHFQTQGHVGGKSGIHEIQVEHVDARSLQASDLGTQGTQIGAHQRGRDLDIVRSDPRRCVAPDLRRRLRYECLSGVPEGLPELVFELSVGVIAAQFWSADLEIAHELGGGNPIRGGQDRVADLGDAHDPPSPLSLTETEGAVEQSVGVLQVDLPEKRKRSPKRQPG